MLRKIEKRVKSALDIGYDKDPQKARRIRKLYRDIRGAFIPPSWVFRPDNIQIDTHNYCNLWMEGKGCIHCNVKPSGGWDLPRGRMPSEMISYIIEYWGSRGSVSIAPYINGEPMLDERLPWICDISKENNLHVVVDTNGTLYDKRENLVHPNMLQVRITFSAITPETYEIVHGASLFKEAESTVKWFLKNRHPDQYPMLYFITNKFNMKELFGYVKQWIGKAHLTLFPLHEVEGIQTESTLARPDPIEYWEEITKKLTGRYPSQSYRPIDVYPDGKREARLIPPYSCCQGTDSFSVAWNGLLLHCTDIPYIYNYGHIYEKDMLETWHIRNRAKIGHPACHKCNVKRPDHDAILKRYLGD